MIDSRTFNLMARVAQIVRSEPEKPFGGLQVVVTGDFLQLPPVTDKTREPLFAFNAGAWRDTLEREVELIRVFRQTDNSKRVKVATLGPYVDDRCRTCGCAELSTCGDTDGRRSNTVRITGEGTSGGAYRRWRSDVQVQPVVADGIIPNPTGSEIRQRQTFEQFAGGGIPFSSQRCGFKEFFGRGVVGGGGTGIKGWSTGNVGEEYGQCLGKWLGGQGAGVLRAEATA